ncbi:MAG: peptidoglycan DD-metalloendopeptidase family protein [Pseudomonadota bacterium]
MLCTLCIVPAQSSMSAPTSSDELRTAIKDEEARVKKQKENLSRLTAEERKLNSNLAKAESSMSKLEVNIAKQEKELEALQAAMNKVRASQEKLETKLHANAQDLEALLQILWPLYVQRHSGQASDDLSQTDMPHGQNHWHDTDSWQNTDEWHGMERDYMWAQELCLLIATRKKDMSEEETAIAATLKEREALMAKVQKQMASINKDREKLLQDRLAFRQQLTKVRKQKQNTADDLNDVLAIIQKYNVRLEQMEGRDITKLKGYLSWPVAGKRVKEWNPSAKEPMRGIAFACNQGAKVKAVAWGKVAHNDILRGLGRVVILMHDKNYYTLYAYLGDSPLKVGQTVTSGEVIGTAGFYPEVNSSGLYFELRSHQKPIDPRPWLSKNG